VRGGDAVSSGMAKRAAGSTGGGGAAGKGPGGGAGKSAGKSAARRSGVDEGEALLGTGGRSSGSAARDWVPVSLDEVIGQASAVSTLRANMASGRVHHCWIFHGPSGVGKMTAARAFAAELLRPREARTAPTARDAEVVELLARGRHPDLHLVTKALASVSREPDIRKSKQTTIAKIVVEEFVLEPAARGRVVECDSVMGKVFIIDGAEELDRSPSNAPVQNSMLKTLEEPAPGTAFILVTTDEHRLLATVRSRAQRVGFGALDEASMARWLSERSVRGAGGEAMSAEERGWVLGFAEGSPGAAELALEHGLHEWARAVEPLLEGIERGDGSAGLALGATMGKLVGERAEASVAGRPEASKEAANRFWARVMLSLVAAWSRRRLLWAAKRGDAVSMERWSATIDAVRQSEEHVEGNVQLALALEQLGSRLVSLARGEVGAA
jgi:DNA polymerase-3 subunit delta'